MTQQAATPPPPTTTSNPEPDRAAAVAFLAAVRPVGYWVLVAIVPDSGQIRTRSFAAREVDVAGEWLERMNREGWNVYWTVNSVLRPLASKPSREDVATVDFLHVDVDPDKRLDLAKERVRIERLFGPEWPQGVPPASIVIDSGGGRQGFWRLDVPFRIDGRPEAYEDAARYNQQLEVLFRADPCHNVDRIMRLPGTVNWPDAKKRAAGRYPRLATLVSIAPTSYPITDFTPAAKVQSADEGFVGQTVKVETGNVARLLSLDELPTGVSGPCKVVISQGMDPDNPRRWPSRSEPLFWACCEMVRAGVSDEIIYSVITDRDFRISESVLEKGPRAERYALQQIEHAHEHCTHPALAELNRRHAVIADTGGRCRVIAEGWDPVLRRERLSLQTFEDFTNRYSNRFVDVGEPDKLRQEPLGKWWLRHPMRRQFDQILFAPGQEVRGSYNLWRGFACEARPGDCSLYLAHVRDNICRGDETLCDYLLSWMALAVQKPGERGHIAVVLRGTRGTGKGVFATTFGQIFGRHFFPVVNPMQLFGQFNEHLQDIVVLFADEAFYAGDKRSEAILKALVTESTRVSEAKYRTSETTANCLHIIMAANNDWVVPAGTHERRYLVLDVAEDQRQNRGYFRAIDAQMESGGREALLHLLTTRDLSDYDPRDVPKTAALQDQKEQSLSPEESWWYEKLSSGELREGQPWPEWVPCSELAFDFSQGVMRNTTHGVSANRLGRFLRRVGVQRRQLSRRVDVVTRSGELRRVDRPRVYAIPPLDEARHTWEQLLGGDFNWERLEILEDKTPEEQFA